MTNTILVVDDEPMVLGFLNTALRRAGFDVFTARDATTALRLCREHGTKIDLALIDYMLPGMNGADLYCMIQSLLPSMRLMLMSGFPRGLTEGATNTQLPDGHVFIEKPFRLAELISAIELVLEIPPYGKRAMHA
jgi:DNA-binding response OmpR family regulator